VIDKSPTVLKSYKLPTNVPSLRDDSDCLIEKNSIKSSNLEKNRGFFLEV
jgi:hypothetical protein